MDELLGGSSGVDSGCAATQRKARASDWTIARAPSSPGVPRRSAAHLPLAPVAPALPPSSTTILAVAYAGGVILGADSRTSTGAYIANRVSDKLTAVHDSIYCCRSGSAADTQAVSDFVRRFLAEHAIDKGAAPTVAAAAKLFRTLCYENKDRLMAGIIVAGWDAVEGGSVYEIPLGGTCVRQGFAIGGSGSSYVYGFVDSTYRADMPKDEKPAAGGGHGGYDDMY